MLHHFFCRRHGFAGAVAVAGIALDGNGADAVEAADGRRAGGDGLGQDGIERNHFSRRRFDGNKFQAVRFGAVAGVGLQHDFVSAAELVEVIHLGAAEVHLQSGEYIGKLDAQIFYLLAVHCVLVARRIRFETAAHSGKFGALVRCLHDLRSQVAQLFIREAGVILHLHGPAAFHAKARERRRTERHDLGLRMVACHFRIEGGNNGGESLFGAGAVRPIFQTNVQIAGAGGAVRHDSVHAGDLPRFFGDSVHHFHRLVHGRAFGHGDACHEHALVLVRHEGGGDELVEEAHESADQNQEAGGVFQMMNHPAHLAGVLVADGVKGAVEFPEEFSQHPFLRRRVIGLENHTAQSRRQGERHDGGDGHRYGDGESELLVQHAHGTAQERHGNEDGGQYGGGGDDRPLHFVHGEHGGFLRRETVPLHVLFHVFNDHDGVIDHHADGKHQGKEGQRIDGEIENDEGGEGTDDGNRHRQHGNQSGAPFLEEHEYHQDNQQKGLDESHFHFFDGRIDEGGVIDDDFIIQIRREILFRFCQDFLHRRHRFQGVRIVGELHAETDAGLAVDFRIAVRALRPGDHFRDVLQPHELAIGAGLDDNISKLLRRGEAAFHFRAVLLLLVLRRRRRAYGACRSGLVLLLDGAGHVRHREPALGELVRIQPHAHGVGGAESVHVAHAADALQFIQEINVRVVFQKCGVVGAVRRIQIHHQRHVAGGFADRQPAGLYFAGQTILRQVRRVLHIHRVRISVGVQIKDDGKIVAAAVRRGGGHVVHALDAVQLVLQHLGDGLIHRLRVGAGVAGGQIDGGRRNLRILRDGQADQGNRTQEHNDQRHHDGKDRPPYKEF